MPANLENSAVAVGLENVLKFGSWTFSTVVSTELKSCNTWVQNLDLGQFWCCDTDKLDGMIVVLVLAS